MPGTVATAFSQGVFALPQDRPHLLIRATLTNGQASAPSTTTKIGVSDSIKIPKNISELALTYKVTAAQTDSGDSTFALVEAQYQDEWVPLLSTAAIAGNVAEPYLKGATHRLSGSPAGWQKDNKTAAAAALTDFYQTPQIAEAVRIAFYVTADADGTQDDLFTGTAELWAI